MRTNVLTLRHIQFLNQQFNVGLLKDGENSCEAALARGLNPTPTFRAKRLRRRGKFVYQAATPVDDVLQHAVKESLRAHYRARQSSRDELVTNLLLFLNEGCSLRIYRFDIKDFFESIPRHRIMDEVRENPFIPTTSTRILGGIFEYCEEKGVPGLPRGLAVSATLAEQYLQTFDAQMQSCPDVFLFLRFVDDILIVTSGTEEVGDIDDFVRQRLSEIGLQLNPKKCSVADFDQPGKEFYYLGYDFKLVSMVKYQRVWRIDLADRKVRKIKTMIICALIAYGKSKDYQLLFDRLRFLAGNYIVSRRSEHEALRAGIYYSYPRISDADALGGSLRQLDVFVRHVLTSKRLKPSVALASQFKAQQRSRLLKLSFVVGHKMKYSVRFSSERLGEIGQVWHHV